MTLWTECVFEGRPPKQYKNWGDCLRSSTIKGLIIRKLTKEEKKVHFHKGKNTFLTKHE
jgi:hypothetical protein